MRRSVAAVGVVLLLLSGCVVQEYYPYYYPYQPYPAEAGYGGPAPGEPAVVDMSRRPVPAVVGMGLDEAREALKAADLALGRVRYRRMPGREGVVVSQRPGPSALLPPYSRVDLVVGAGMRMVAVPDVLGLPPAAARQALASVGLTVGRVEARPAPHLPEDQVIRQSVRPGAFVPLGTVVSLVVGTRSAGVPVPSVKGMTVIEAGRALARAGFTLGSVETVPVPSASAGRVVAQEPAAGSRARYGSVVNVKVGEAYSLVRVPDLIGKDLQTASRLLNEAGLKRGKVEYARGARPPFAVAAQSPPAGRGTVKGSPVDLTLGSASGRGSAPGAAVKVPSVVGMDEKSAVRVLVFGGSQADGAEKRRKRARPGQEPVSGGRISGGPGDDGPADDRPGQTREESGPDAPRGR